MAGLGGFEGRSCGEFARLSGKGDGTYYGFADMDGVVHIRVEVVIWMYAAVLLDRECPAEKRRH